MKKSAWLRTGFGILSCVLVLSGLAFYKRGSDRDVTASFFCEEGKYSFSFYNAVRKENALTSCNLSPEMFEEDPSLWNRDIALLSASLLMALDEGKAGFYGIGETEFFGRGEYILRAYRELGFRVGTSLSDSDVSLFSFPKSLWNETDVPGASTEDEDFAYSVAFRAIGEGEDAKNLVTVLLRGTETLAELFADGVLTQTAVPFMDTETFPVYLAYYEDVMAGIRYFLGKHEKEMAGKETCFLVAGHSLGGAAAELVAADLTENSDDGTKVYAYTFGALNALTEERTSDYTNIWNVMNELDTYGPKGKVWDVFKPSKGGETFTNKFGSVLIFSGRDYNEIMNTDYVSANHSLMGYYDAAFYDFSVFDGENTVFYTEGEALN